MTWSDPIVDEVRRVREAYAARFHHDLRAIYRDLKEQEKRSGRQVVPYRGESPAVESHGTQELTGATPSVSQPA